MRLSKWVEVVDEFEEVLAWRIGTLWKPFSILKEVNMG